MTDTGSTLGDPARPDEGAGGAARRTLLTPSRRGFLSGAAATSLGFWLWRTSSSDDGPLQVAVVWTGGEQRVFLDVVEGYGAPVDVVSGGDDIHAFLRSRADARNFPDVAILSRPGLVHDYARRGWLEPLPDSLADRFPDWWNELVTVRAGPGQQERLYGAWAKAAHKSLFWYRPSLVDGSPWTWAWDDLKEWAVTRAGDPDGPPPLGVAAGDGWVLTDWLENLIAARAELDLYEALAAGATCWDAEAVRTSLTDLGELWRVPGVVADGHRATLVDFEDAVRRLADRDVAMVYEGDFVAAFLERYLPEDPAGTGWDDPTQFRFPSVDGHKPVVVGGDVAVVRRGSHRGVAFVEWLTDVLALDRWMAELGYLTPNEQIEPGEGYRDPDQIGIATHMLTTAAEDLRFDLSDRLPAPLTGADGQGSWQIMTDFFEAVTTRGLDVAGAVDQAVRRFNEAARSAGGSGGCGRERR